ncbi:MAG: hypothetical protein M3247_02155 [Thermoproteota archaeon]|nr:hypothetical protein [Thermoproteota archaeon]
MKPTIKIATRTTTTGVAALIVAVLIISGAGLIPGGRTDTIVAFGQLTAGPPPSDDTASSNAPNNNPTNGPTPQTAQEAEGGYIIKMLHFYEDGTGWLTTSYDDSINACEIWFSHTLTPANGHYYTMGSGEISGVDFENTPLSEIITTIDYRNCPHIPIKMEFVRGQTNWNGDPLFEKQQYEQQPPPPTTNTTTAAPPITSTTSPMAPINPNGTSVTGTPRPLTMGTPTNDPELIKFNQIAAQCASMSTQLGEQALSDQNGGAPSQYGLNSFEQCITVLKGAVHRYCEDFTTYDAAKCQYINTPQMQGFLSAGERAVTFGSILNRMLGQSSPLSGPSG